MGRTDIFNLCVKTIVLEKSKENKWSHVHSFHGRQIKKLAQLNITHALTEGVQSGAILKSFWSKTWSF
jgi:hypothetical protein